MNKLCIWTMLIGLCFWFGGLNPYFAEGENRKQELEIAKEALKQSISANPDDANAHYALGIIYEELGDWKNAIESLKQAVRLNPKDDGAHYGLGVAYYQLGDYQKAIESSKEAVRLKPDYAEAHHNLGMAYGGLGDYKKAIESYKEAVRLKPDFAEAHYFLGWCCYILNDYQKAIESYKEAIRVNPDYALAHTNLGAAYVKLGEWSKAIESFKQAVRINPNDVATQYNLGAAYFSVGDRGSALEQYKILKGLNKDMADKLYNAISGTAKNAGLTADEAVKKIESKIFYPDEQENLESAEYTLIYGPQMIMAQFNMKLEYGNKAKAKGKEQGSLKPEALRKKEAPKKPDAKNEKDGKTVDKSRTWPDYEVNIGIWRLADPANLLMQLFAVPLHQTFPEDKWERELTEQDGGYDLVFIPKTQRPISGNDPGILIVNSITLTTDKEFVVNKIKLTFDQSAIRSLGKSEMGAMTFAESSDIEVAFTKYKDKLLIKEMKQTVAAAGMRITPTYTFEFKEASGFLLPTVKHIESPGSELSGTLGGMEFHFLLEYLDYKVKAKKK